MGASGDAFDVLTTFSVVDLDDITSPTRAAARANLVFARLRDLKNG